MLFHERRSAGSGSRARRAGAAAYGRGRRQRNGSFHTDKARRDSHVTSERFLDAPAYPTMTFTGTAPERRPDGRWQLAGALTVRDTTTEVPVTVVESTATATGFRLTGTARVDRHAAGVTVAKGFIGRYVDVTLDITATACR